MSAPTGTRVCARGQSAHTPEMVEYKSAAREERGYAVHSFFAIFHVAKHFWLLFRYARLRRFYSFSRLLL